MGEITVYYHSSAMTATKRTSDRFLLPENGLKASSLARAIISRYSHSDIERVLENSRWIVDGQSVDPFGSFVLKGGEEVNVTPRLVGG